MKNIFSFEASEKESEAAKEWIKEHRKTCKFFKTPRSAGAAGGALSFVVTPTTIGTAFTVRCACGALENVTDYDTW